MFGDSLELQSLERIVRAHPAASLEVAISSLHAQLGEEYLSGLPHRKHADYPDLQHLERAYGAMLAKTYGDESPGAEDADSGTVHPFLDSDTADIDDGPASSQQALLDRAPDPHKGAFDPTTHRYYPPGTQPEHSGDKNEEHSSGGVMSTGLDDYLSAYKKAPAPPAAVTPQPVPASKAAPVKPADDIYLGSGGTAKTPGAWIPVNRPPVSDADGLKPISHLRPSETRQAPHFTVLSEYPGPRVYQVDDYLSAAEVDEIMQYSHSQIARFGSRTETGIALEMRADETPLLRSIMARQLKLLGIQSQEKAQYFRVRRYCGCCEVLSGSQAVLMVRVFAVCRYEKQEYHPLHTDTYSFKDSTLIATVLVYLTSPAEGGDTFFPLAYKDRSALPDRGRRLMFPDIDYTTPVNRSEMLAVKPVAGRLLIWLSCDPAGMDDPLSIHGSMPLVDGVKWTITNFVSALTPHDQLPICMVISLTCPVWCCVDIDLLVAFRVHVRTRRRGQCPAHREGSERTERAKMNRIRTFHYSSS